ncbi:MAG: integrase core domain-containing protein [Planctomycetota bacterium]|jgi:putative transposase|nr:integrase core domain-containing protein [Planctomycetota bacterium]
MTPESPTAESAALIIACAAAIHQDLYRLIELQNEHIRVLKRIVGKPARATDPEKRRLAVRSQVLSRAILAMAETIVSVDTFRRWHRTLIANTYTSHRRGRPRVHREIEALVCRLARENPAWGCRTIADRMGDLGHAISHQTVATILKRNGLPTAPERERATDWQAFIEAHWPGLVAIDFATWEVPSTDTRRTQRHHAFYAIRVATREVRLLGVTDRADGAWVTQCCRTITDVEEPFMDGVTTIIHDGDPLYTTAARTCLGSDGRRLEQIAPGSPWCNGFIERFIGTTRREVGRRIIPFSGDILERCLREHVSYYNHVRTHQGLDSRRIPRPLHDRFSASDGEVIRRSLLGNTLGYYTREAA